MKVVQNAIIPCWSILLALHGSVQAQTTRGGPDALKSARSFVNEFYSWYVPEVLKFASVLPSESVRDKSGEAPSDLALKYRNYVFTPELFKALKEDSDAQDSCPGYICGLDYDPFLATQDPAELYELGKITRKGNTYLVEVFGIYQVRRPELPEGVPAVIAEVARRNGRWVFTNFLYPQIAKEFPKGADLLSELKGQRNLRRGTGAKHR